MNTTCGYCAFLGSPNAGKSTLLNALVGQKLAIVTPKAQTTRNRITGVVLHENAQIILVDVPGVFDVAETKPFERAMVSCAWGASADADVVGVMMDARRGLDDENKEIIARVKQMSKPAILILNKIDLVAKEVLLTLAMQANELHPFEKIFMISALKGDGVEDVKAYLAQRMPQGPWLFPEDQLTDISERLLASEITREVLFMRLNQELPYALHVETESWEEFDNGSVKISQVIVVERDGHKGIILGKNGATLKAIGEQSRKEIEKLWDRRAHLKLFVKVREHWKNDPDAYHYMGLEKRK